MQDISTIAKPWLSVPDKKKKWHTIFPVTGIIIGLLAACAAVYQGATTVTNHKYCSIYEVDFSNGGQLDPKIWTRELSVGGFG